MKVKKTFKKIIAVAGVLFSLFTSFTQPLTANAESASIKDFSTTAIEDDLRELGCTESSLYPKDENGTPAVVSFVEYCYGIDESYGLYFYVYNPTEMEVISETSGKVTLGVNQDKEGRSQTWFNSTFTLVDETENKRFLKLKINSDVEDILSEEKTYAQNNDGTRRYEITTLRLFKVGATRSVDVDVDKVYAFTGTAKYGNATTSTLVCQSYQRLNLDTHFAHYRTGDYQNYVCDEVQTVYFSVPQEYFDSYGFLQQITAEWEEYKTTPIFVTSDLDVFNGLYTHLGEEIFTTNEKGELVQKYSSKEMPWNVLWEREFLGYTYMYRAYNGFCAWYKGNSSREDDAVSRMDWLFYRDADKIATDKDYAVTKEQIEYWAKTYRPVINPALGGYITSPTGQAYHEYLFENEIDEERQSLLTNAQFGAKRGHIRQTIDAGDNSSITVETPQNWWDKFWKGAKYEEKGYKPIVVFNTENPLPLSVDYFAQEYLISDSEKQEVYDFCKTALENGEYPVLLKYAVTDYYTCEARFDKAGNNALSDVDGYVAQETVFLGFDIISLLFRNGVQDTLVSVASNPVDVFKGTDAPPGLGENPFTQWWKNVWSQYKWYIIGGVAVILLFLFWPLWSLAIKGVALLIKGTALGCKYIGIGIWIVVKWIGIGIGKFFGWIGKGIAKIFKRG